LISRLGRPRGAPCCELSASLHIRMHCTYSNMRATCTLPHVR
jgi:hypothetical protein